MAIGAFGTDPASKFATEPAKPRNLEEGVSWDSAPPTVWNTVIRYRKRTAIRSGSAGLDFQKGSLRFRFPVVFFIPFNAPRAIATHWNAFQAVRPSCGAGVCIAQDGEPGGSDREHDAVATVLIRPP